MQYVFIFILSTSIYLVSSANFKFDDNTLSYEFLRPYPAGKPFGASPNIALPLFNKYTNYDNPYFFYPMNVVNETGSLHLEYTRYAQNFELGLQKGHIFRISNPRTRFSVLQPLGGCPGRVKTSVTSLANKCTAASNAGFFDVATGGCLGNLITDGVFVQSSDKLNINFGTTKDGQYILGYITEPELLKIKGYLNNLVSGAIWLVRNGNIFVNQSRDIEGVSEDFITLKAPRMAVGFDISGNLLLVDVDGDEPTKGGLDLYEFSSFLLNMGIYNAVNIDGGGSTTVVKDTNTINFPSDPCKQPLFTNVIERCERTVTTILCVHEARN